MEASAVMLLRKFLIVSDVFEQRRYVLLIYLVPDSSMYYLREIICLYIKVRVHSYIDLYLLMKLIGKYISFVPNNSGFVFVIGGFVMNSLFD